jgi:GT2 family glycosyltransferase
MPKVSAIISAYYCEEFLEGRITNLLNQSLVPEIIVVCQIGSEEADICEPFPGINLWTVDVPTIYRAWNIGLCSTSGDYIINANADDRLSPDAIEVMAQALDDHPDKALVYGAVNVIGKYGEKPGNVIANRDGDYERLKSDYFIGPMPMWRRSLHDKYGYFDETLQICGDYDFWLRCAKGGEKFYRLPRVVGTYLKRTDSAEHRNPILSKYENQLVRERYANA